MPISNPEQVAAALRRYRSVAVLGAHPNPVKAAHYVPRYLAGEGYAVYPVNPAYAGATLFGQSVRASLAELEEPPEIVNVFRRSEHLKDHLPELLALGPKLVWFQLGIRDPEVTRQLEAAGTEVVEDRCMLVDHQRLL